MKYRHDRFGVRSLEESVAFLGTSWGQIGIGEWRRVPNFAGLWRFREVLGLMLGEELGLVKM